MKHGWSDSGRFGQRLWFTTSEIDRMCLLELRKAGCLPEEPSPIDIERFVEKHYSRIEYLDLGEGVLGCTEFSKNGSVLRVVISSSLDGEDIPSERRLRSTVAHEAGHCMMHPPLFIDDSLQATFQNENVDLLQQRKILCRDTDIRADREAKKIWDGKWWEYQANRAIGGFLLPKRLVIMALKPSFLREGFMEGDFHLDNTNRDAAISFLADTFDVNPAVARIRLEEMYPEKNSQMTF